MRLDYSELATHLLACVSRCLLDHNGCQLEILLYPQYFILHMHRSSTLFVGRVFTWNFFTSNFWN